MYLGGDTLNLEVDCSPIHVVKISKKSNIRSPISHNVLFLTPEIQIHTQRT